MPVQVSLIAFAGTPLLGDDGYTHTCHILIMFSQYRSYLTHVEKENRVNAR